MAGMQPGGVDVWTCKTCGRRIGERCHALRCGYTVALVHKLSPELIGQLSLREGDSELGRDARVVLYAWEHHFGSWLNFCQVKSTPDCGEVRARLERLALALGFVAV